MFTSLSFLSLYVCVFVCVLACVCAFVHACPLLSHEMIIPFIALMLQESRVSHCGSWPCRSTGGTLFRRPFHLAGWLAGLLRWSIHPCVCVCVCVCVREIVCVFFYLVLLCE